MERQAQRMLLSQFIKYSFSRRISFNLPIADVVSIKVFDITGRELLTLKDDYTLAGSHTINWDASSHPSGVYLLQMTSGSFSKTRKIVLMK